MLEAGPEEFLSLMRYAQAVLTDSYHGTLFSINFHKTFWVYTEGTKEHELGTRRGQVLQELGLTDRIITDFTQIPSAEVKNGTAIDYAEHARPLDCLSEEKRCAPRKLMPNEMIGFLI